MTIWRPENGRQILVGLVFDGRHIDLKEVATAIRLPSLNCQCRLLPVRDSFTLRATTTSLGLCIEMNLELNAIASELVEDVVDDAESLRVIENDTPGEGLLLDFGVDAEGGLEAGCALASISTSGLADITLTPGLLDGIGWTYVTVVTDSPVAACLFSQYAGWQISVDKFFAMGSGPMRAAYAKEPLFDKLWYREESDQVVGVLETPKLPGPEVFQYIANQIQVEPSNVVVCVAPPKAAGSSSVSSNAAPDASSTRCRRSAGQARSRGRYAAPDLRIARTDTISSMERSRHTATSVSEPAPCATR